jgi:hypothetical protein
MIDLSLFPEHKFEVIETLTGYARPRRGNGGKILMQVSVSYMIRDIETHKVRQINDWRDAKPTDDLLDSYVGLPKSNTRNLSFAQPVIDVVRLTA